MSFRKLFVISGLSVIVVIFVILTFIRVNHDENTATGENIDQSKLVITVEEGKNWLNYRSIMLFLKKNKSTTDGYMVGRYKRKIYWNDICDSQHSHPGLAKRAIS